MMPGPEDIAVISDDFAERLRAHDEHYLERCR